MIGLKRHTVQVVEHDPGWGTLFEAEARTVRKAIGDLVVDVQHVGSTAVAGLQAKPILDIAVAVSSCDAIPALVQRLAAIGYMDRGDGGNDGGYLLVRESAPEVRTVHLHIVAVADPQWRDYLAFREILRTNADVRNAYAALKQELGVRYVNDRKRYTASKNDFIRKILGREPGRGGTACD